MAEKTRQSNMELLRIMSMIFVLFVHFDGASLGLPSFEEHHTALTASDYWQLWVEALTIIGVNCFTLISGYFAIRLRWKSVGKYLFQCVFYAVGIYSALLLISPAKFTWTGWGESWLVLTHTDLWYVPAYFALMLLSPFINAGFEKMEKKMATIVTLAFVVFNVWAGWWNGGSFNANGYTMVQLVMMYMIGRCIALHRDRLSAIRPSRLSFCSLVIYAAVSAIIVYTSPYDLIRGFAYNSPLVIISSVAFFMIFYPLKIENRVINYIAKSSFSVYLLHKAPLVWGGVLKPLVNRLWESMTLFEFTLAIIALALSVYACAMVVDIVRRRASRLLFRTM